MATEWPNISLGEVVEIRHGFAFKSKFFTDTPGPIVLTPGNFREEGGFTYKNPEKFYCGPIPDRYILSPGDLLVVMTEQKAGLLGSAALVPATGTFLHNQRLGLVMERAPERIHRRFLYYLFNSPHVRQQIQATANGTKVRHTSPDRLKEVQVCLPPLAIQERIASILAAYDELIENNLRRIDMLEDMAQALYREWFCEFRFPGHEDVDLVDSELGPIPLGWAIGHFREICQSVRSPVSPHKEPDAAFYHYSFAAYDRDQTPDVEYGRDVKSSKLKVAQPSVLLAKLNPRIPRVWRAIPPGDLPAYASSEFIVLVPKRTKLTYLYAAASNSEFTRRLAAMSVGTSSSHQRLKVQDFEQMPVVLPPDALVDLYDKHCGPMLELAEKLRQQNANLRTTRDLLLPKLVSGEIDVSDLDIDTDWLVA